MSAKKTGREAPAQSLKAQNRPTLLAVAMVNLAILVMFTTTKQLSLPGVFSLVREWDVLAPATFVGVICGIVNELTPSSWKPIIVFWKIKNPMPASEAFTRFGPADPRVDMAQLEAAYGPLPAEGAEQNKLWYSIYTKVEGETVVRDVHKMCLLTRDYTCMSLLMWVGFTPCALYWVPNMKAVAIYGAMLFLQFMLVRTAAVNTGRRFVTTVLAIGAQAMVEKHRSG